MIEFLKTPGFSPTDIMTLDKRGPGGAHHTYAISEKRTPSIDVPADPTFAMIKFQQGPVKEDGVNGCQNEDLILIVIDRLKSFERSDWSCPENIMAILHLETALHALYERTRRRTKKGVEGTSAKEK